MRALCCVSMKDTVVRGVRTRQHLGRECRRMDFSIRCAYAHGTCALRTHLINMVPKQLELTWPAFDRLRQKWKGKVINSPAASSNVLLTMHRMSGVMGPMQIRDAVQSCRWPSREFLS